jgi:diacylglycerol kinase family enzyme
VRRVDSHPRLKARANQWYFTWAAVSSFYSQYLRDPVQIGFRTGDQSIEGVTAIFQNSDPFTYFGRRPVEVCDGAEFSNGTLSAAVLRRAAQRDMPTIATRVLNPRLRASKHRQIDHFEGLTEAKVESLSRDQAGEQRRFPVQVDGDYIGEFAELDVGIEPGALTIVA